MSFDQNVCKCFTIHSISILRCMMMRNNQEKKNSTIWMVTHPIIDHDDCVSVASICRRQRPIFFCLKLLKQIRFIHSVNHCGSSAAIYCLCVFFYSGWISTFKPKKFFFLPEFPTASYVINVNPCMCVCAFTFGIIKLNDHHHHLEIWDWKREKKVRKFVVFVVYVVIDHYSSCPFGSIV